MARTKGGAAYDLTGPADAPAVVLIHGLGLTRQSTWADIVSPLAARFRVPSYDLCGHGETVLRTQAPDLTLLSEQLATLMDELGIGRAALVGFSLGGMINRRFAIDHPSRVTALAILNSPLERSADAQKLVEDRAAATQEGGPGATIDTTLMRWFTEGFRDGHPDRVDEIRRVVLANDQANYGQHRLVLAHGVKELIRLSPALAVPTLVMTCEHDSGSTPAMSHAIVREIEGAETLIVRDLQHLGLIEQPDRFSAPLLTFLYRALQTKDREMTQ